MKQPAGKKEISDKLLTAGDLPWLKVLLSELARPEGFEPPACGFEVQKIAYSLMGTTA